MANALIVFLLHISKSDVETMPDENENRHYKQRLYFT